MATQQAARTAVGASDLVRSFTTAEKRRRVVWARVLRRLGGVAEHLPPGGPGERQLDALMAAVFDALWLVHEQNDALLQAIDPSRPDWAALRLSKYPAPDAPPLVRRVRGGKGRQ